MEIEIVRHHRTDCENKLKTTLFISLFYSDKIRQWELNSLSLLKEQQLILSLCFGIHT